MRLITYTDDYDGMSRRDVEMARQISAAARRLGLSADPAWWTLADAAGNEVDIATTRGRG